MILKIHCHRFFVFFLLCSSICCGTSSHHLRSTWSSGASVCVCVCVQLFAFGGGGPDRKPMWFSVHNFSFKNFFPTLPFVFLLFLLSTSILIPQSPFIFLPPSVHSLSQLALLFLSLFLPLHLVLASISVGAPSVLEGLLNLKR